MLKKSSNKSRKKAINSIKGLFEHSPINANPANAERDMQANNDAGNLTAKTVTHDA